MCELVKNFQPSVNTFTSNFWALNPLPCYHPSGLISHVAPITLLHNLLISTPDSHLLFTWLQQAVEVFFLELCFLMWITTEGKSSPRWDVLKSQLSVGSHRHNIYCLVYSSLQFRWRRKKRVIFLILGSFGWNSQGKTLYWKQSFCCTILLSRGLAGLAFLLFMQQVNEQEQMHKQGTVPWNLNLPSQMH